MAISYRVLAAVFAVSLLAIDVPANLSAADTRPNIVLIIADDMGWEDCGSYGNKRIKTPQLERLAKEGMRFDNMILTCSSCSPSRSSLITSRFPPVSYTHLTLPTILRV